MEIGLKSTTSVSKNKNTDDAKSELRNLCYAVLAVPLVIQSNLSGKAVPRLLSETTGLSPSRLRMNSRANFRASTIQRSRKSGEEMTRNHLKNIGYSEGEILTILNYIEAPRDLWRLPYLREWSHEEIQQVFP